MRFLGVSGSSVNIQKFSLRFSLSLIFSVSMSTWHICSISMNFACVLKLWFLPEKWRLAGIASGFHTSFRWLLSLMLNSVSAFPYRLICYFISLTNESSFFLFNLLYFHNFQMNLALEEDFPIEITFFDICTIFLYF